MQDSLITLNIAPFFLRPEDSEAYFEPSRISMMKAFAKEVNYFWKNTPSQMFFWVLRLILIWILET